MSNDVQPADRPGARQPQFIGQATAVEQARAVAQVQAAVLVAMERPRDMEAVAREVVESCRQTELADRAFYRFRRDGKQVTGPSVHLAREIARCFGNFDWNVDELRRDDEAGESEVKAWAWDMQKNSRASRTFIVPHVRDTTKDGRKKLTTARDVQEMIANQGARVVREQILDLIPEWLVQRAITACNETIEKGESEKPLAERVADTIASFADKHGVTKSQLEDKVGRKADQWVAQDLSALRVIWTSLYRGEVTRDDEFPTQKVTAAEIKANTAKAKAKPEPAAPAEAEKGPESDDVWVGPTEGESK